MAWWHGLALRPACAMQSWTGCLNCPKIARPSHLTDSIIRFCNMPWFVPVSWCHQSPITFDDDHFFYGDRYQHHGSSHKCMVVSVLSQLMETNTMCIYCIYIIYYIYIIHVSPKNISVSWYTSLDDNHPSTMPGQWVYSFISLLFVLNLLYICYTLYMLHAVYTVYIWYMVYVYIYNIYIIIDICQKECHIECRNTYQIECQIYSQNICQIEYQLVGITRRKYAFHFFSVFHPAFLGK